MTEEIKKIIDFFQIINRLKRTYRYSECIDNINMQDSSADHFWRLSFMAFMVIDKLNLNINTQHALKIALVHDVAELVNGDIDAVRVHNGEITKEQKEKMEHDALLEITKDLPQKEKQEILSIWKEYSDGKTKEARFMNALDKIETLSHLVYVGYKHFDVPDLLAIYADNKVKLFPKLLPILKEVKLRLKQEYKKADFKWKKEYNYGLED